jgi:CRP/FNR family transcriptional regulator, cyclic AMP receptor protein
MARAKSAKKPRFEVEKYLRTAGVERKILNYTKGQTIFSQGEACHEVMYLQRGGVKLSITSSAGKEAVIAMLDAGEFFGEGAIAGQPMRVATAVATEATSVLLIAKQEMIRVLHDEHEFSDRFVAYMLQRNVRVEEDLTDQLFNSSEKRLARALLLVARYGKEDQPEKVIARISQETLAEMIGTTRSRVSFFMNRFRKLGYIKYNGGLSINSSLLRVVLHD